MQTDTLTAERASGRVLVVDDDPSLRLLAQETLIQEGYEVLLAENGHEACELFATHSPDFVLMDVCMPVLNGCDACARLRRADDGAQTPVLMITGSDDPAVVEQVFDSGATDFQAKPLNWRVIRERIRYMLHAKRAADGLRRLAHYDSLTGLPNRGRFHGELGRAVAAAERTEGLLAVVFLDLDGFKEINDAFGHRDGDTILKETADRLVQSLRASDLLLHGSAPQTLSSIGRIGGDEFTILAPNLADVQSAASLSQRVRDALAAPFHVAGQDVWVTASVGVSVYPFDGTDADALLKHADAAMYYNKSLARGSRPPDGEPRSSASLKRSLAKELGHALGRNELRLHFQPIVAIDTDRITSAEALLRWQHPTRREVSPVQFVGLAEELGLGVEIGQWAMQAALRAAVDWTGLAGRAVPVAVNLSNSQLRDRRLLDRIRRVLDETGLEANRFEVEIMESLITHDPSATYRLLEGLWGLGIRASIDNFGTRPWAMSALQDLVVDTVKLDRCFARDVAAETAVHDTAAELIDAAHSSGIAVVAEGVETQEQLDRLAAIGCDQAQGFLFGEPRPARAFEQQLLGLYLGS